MSDSIEWTWRDETIRVGVDHRGQGPTVLMLPALSSISTRSEMRPLAEKLASIFTTIAIDWPGFGDQPRPSVAWEPDAYRAFLAHILQELPKPTATVAAGHAAGYLLRHAAEHPGSAGCLCLVAPTWRGPLPTMMGGRRTMFRYISRTRRSASDRFRPVQTECEPADDPRDGPRTRLCRFCLARRASPRRETCGDQCAGRSACFLPLCRRRTRSYAHARIFYGDRTSGYRSYSRCVRGGYAEPVKGRD